MTLAIGRALALATVIVASATTADAFWFNTPCSGGGCQGDNWMQTVKKKNARWPSPYLCSDRHHVRAPFEAMIANGWRRQNLLGAHHFNENATQLTQSGKLKVHWILTQAPEEFRRVFVERSLDDGVTDQRIATAQEFAGLVVDGDARVADTHILSEGRPAATVDFVNTQFRENMPKPTLPAPTQGFNGSN